MLYHSEQKPAGLPAPSPKDPVTQPERDPSTTRTGGTRWWVAPPPPPPPPTASADRVPFPLYGASKQSCDVGKKN
jgi:hypothetical protein